LRGKAYLQVSHGAATGQAGRDFAGGKYCQEREREYWKKAFKGFWREGE